MEINIRTLRDIVNSFRLTQEQREYLVKSIMAGDNADTTWDQIQNKPTFADVATSGNYDDLIDAPDLTVYQLIKDNSLNTEAKTIPAAINEIKESVDSISDPYEINLTNLLSADDSESISTAIGGIDNLNATVQDNRLIVGTISNGSVSVSIRILGNVTTLYYLLDSVVGLTLNEVAITNTSGTLSKRVTTHSVLTENMVINSLEFDKTTLPLSAAQGKVLATDKQNKIDDTLDTEDKTIVGAINEILPKATGVGKVDPNSFCGEIFNLYKSPFGPPNQATGSYSHAEGYKTIASGKNSHAEGNQTTASGKNSHAEGSQTTASGENSHTEGYKNTASGAGSHVEGGQNEAIGYQSHVEGLRNKAFTANEHAEGMCNKSYDSTDVTVRVIHSVGIGSSTNDRKNAHEIKVNGDHYVYGLGNFNGANSADAQTLQEVINSKQETITAGTGIAFEGNTLNVTLDTNVFFVAESVPASPTDEQKKKICLVPADITEEGNFYTEYVWVVDDEHLDGYWEEFGTYKSEVNLTPYLKIEDAKSTYATKNELQEVQNNINGKQDTLVSGQNIKSVNGETLLGEGDIEIKYPFPSADFTHTPCYFIDADNYDASKFSEYIMKGVDLIYYQGNFYRIYQANWMDGYWWVYARDVQNWNKELSFEVNKFSVNDTKHFQISTDETLQTTNKTVVGAINEVNNKIPVYTIVPELTANYTIPANATTREYIYEISIGTTTYNVTAAEGIKWIDNNPPLVEANSKLIISVVNNIAVWGTVYE